MYTANQIEAAQTISNALGRDKLAKLMGLKGEPVVGMTRDEIFLRKPKMDYVQGRETEVDGEINVDARLRELCYQVGRALAMVPYWDVVSTQPGSYLLQHRYSGRMVTAALERSTNKAGKSVFVARVYEHNKPHPIVASVNRAGAIDKRFVGIDQDEHIIMWTKYHILAHILMGKRPAVIAKTPGTQLHARLYITDAYRRELWTIHNGDWKTYPSPENDDVLYDHWLNCIEIAERTLPDTAQLAQWDRVAQQWYLLDIEDVVLAERCPECSDVLSEESDFVCDACREKMLKDPANRCPQCDTFNGSGVVCDRCCDLAAERNAHEG